MARGFLATVAQIAREAERDAQRRAREAARLDAQRYREHVRAQAARERAQKQAARAAAATAKQEAAEAKRAYLEAREAEVEALNAELQERYAALDGILAATLDVDDFFDLETLRQAAVHPAFPAAHLELPTPPPAFPPWPAEPVFHAPAPSKALFGRKKKTAAAEAAAQEHHSRAVEEWRAQVAWTEHQHRALQSEYERVEAAREAAVAAAKEQFARECEEREQLVADNNARLDAFINNLNYGVAQEVGEYFDFVFGGSIYPVDFPVSHEVRFEGETAELAARVSVPPPADICALKGYRYIKKSDEITSTDLSQKAQKDRYASIIEQVTLRTAHEIFEADRKGLVKVLSLEVGTTTNSPATGNPEFIPLAALGIGRERFLELNLAALVPRNALEHLGASLSKNPWKLDAADTQGIRKQ